MLPPSLDNQAVLLNGAGLILSFALLENPRLGSLRQKEFVSDVLLDRSRNFFSGEARKPHFGWSDEADTPAYSR